MTRVELMQPAGLATSPERPVILVVDDEVLLRCAVAEYLRDCGFHVLEAASGAEAVAVLSADVVVDMVFSDVQMPGELNGYALAQWVRTNRPGIHVLLTSGYPGQAKLAAGASADWTLLIKPYDYEYLQQHIRRLTGQRDDA